MPLISWCLNLKVMLRYLSLSTYISFCFYSTISFIFWFPSLMYPNISHTSLSPYPSPAFPIGWVTMYLFWVIMYLFCSSILVSVLIPACCHPPLSIFTSNSDTLCLLYYKTLCLTITFNQLTQGYLFQCPRLSEYIYLAGYSVTLTVQVPLKKHPINTLKWLVCEKASSFKNTCLYHVKITKFTLLSGWW